MSTPLGGRNGKSNAVGLIQGGPNGLPVLTVWRLKLRLEAIAFQTGADHIGWLCNEPKSEVNL